MQLKHKHYKGVLVGKTQRDFKLGANIDGEINVSKWDYYLSEHERQDKKFETYACTIFSGNDCKEAIMMYALKKGLIPKESVKWLGDNGYFKNGFINFDDRIPAMFADIKLGVGTYQWKAANALIKWSLPEGILGETPNTWEKYYNKKEITDEAKLLQIEFNKRFIWHWFWFDDKQNIDNQLRISPAMSVVRFANGEGCLKPKGTYNHAVMEYGKTKEDCRKIDDNYNQRFKKYDPDYIDYRLGFKLTIIKNNNMNINKFLKDNDLKVIWNKDTGAYAFIQHNLAKVIQTKDRDVLALYEMRFRDDGKIAVDNDFWKQLPKGKF